MEAGRTPGSDQSMLPLCYPPKRKPCHLPWPRCEVMSVETCGTCMSGLSTFGVRARLPLQVVWARAGFAVLMASRTCWRSWRRHQRFLIWVLSLSDDWRRGGKQFPKEFCWAFSKLESRCLWARCLGMPASVGKCTVPALRAGAF